MINWVEHKTHLLSECGKYKIINLGQRGGDKYTVYEYDNRPGHKTFSLYKFQGTINECKAWMPPVSKTQAGKRMMHGNSLTAYETSKEKLTGRRKQVYEIIKKHQPITDREIMKRMGFVDPNMVRPRVTELIESQLVIESQNTIDVETNKPVRMVKIREAA